MAVKNSTVLAKAWLEGTNDFQQRIPNPSIEGYDNAVRELFEPYNHDLFNGFANLLVGMMGTYVESKLFENPLRELKKPAAEWGNTERHVAVKYLNAHSYNVSDETLLKLEAPEFREWFYSVNQHRRYEFSWSKYELQRVFANGDSYGFEDLLTATITQMISSDNYDEMNTMIQGFAEAAQHMSLYQRNITAAPTTKALAQELLVKIKTDAGMMQFPSMRYNGIDIPVHENTDTLILWVTPEVDAYLDVMALAELFHVERAEVNFRKIVIPEFPLPNVYAALTSEDFIYARDVWYGIEPPFYNPSNRTYKYYLFHDQMTGVNPVANCVLYTTNVGTELPSFIMANTGFSFVNTVPFLSGGNEYLGYIGSMGVKTKLYTSISGILEPEKASSYISNQPKSFDYQIIATRPGETPTLIELNSRTYIDNEGYLHIQKTGLEGGDLISITATLNYINPTTGDLVEITGDVDVLVADPTFLSKKEFVDLYPNLVYSEAENTIYHEGE